MVDETLHAQRRGVPGRTNAHGAFQRQAAGTLHKPLRLHSGITAVTTPIPSRRGRSRSPRLPDPRATPTIGWNTPRPPGRCRKPWDAGDRSDLWRSPRARLVVDRGVVHLHQHVVRGQIADGELHGLCRAGLRYPQRWKSRIGIGHIQQSKVYGATGLCAHEELVCADGRPWEGNDDRPASAWTRRYYRLARRPTRRLDLGCRLTPIANGLEGSRELIRLEDGLSLLLARSTTQNPSKYVSMRKPP